MVPDETPHESESTPEASDFSTENEAFTSDENLDATSEAFQESKEDESLDDAPQEDRVLSQDEIDSLLGVNSEENTGRLYGMKAIINSGLVAYERLPMLDIVFDRLSRLMSTSLRNFISDNVEVTIEQVASTRFGEYMNSIPLPAIMSVFKVIEWDNFGLLTCDSSFIYAIVDVLLGGRRAGPAMRVEGRPYTTIERGLVEKAIQVVLQDLSAAFEPLCPVTFRSDRLEINPRFATITRPANVCIRATFRIEMDEREGRIDILFPNATLEPVRDLLLQMFMGEKFGRDSIWEMHLAKELWDTQIEVHALLGETTATLNEILNWDAGAKINLPVKPDALVTFFCGAVPMFKGKVGRRNGHVAVKIEDILYKETGT